MRGRIPRQKDIRRTIFGILQSTAFLTTSAFSYSAYLCSLRRLFGGFNLFTVSYVPAFMSSLTAILVERPSRRNLLCLYVANVATETLWRMGVSRGIVKSLPYGQVIIFGLAASVLIYYYRSGLHLQEKDSMFDIIRFIVGKEEEGKDETIEAQSSHARRNSAREHQRAPKNHYLIIQEYLKIHKRITDRLKALPKHEKCPHQDSCLYYTVSGGTKLFGIGLGVQVALKLIFQMKRIFKAPSRLKEILFNRDTLKIGAFLGGFSFIYRVGFSNETGN